jgi:hypothetical protein
MDFDSNMYRGVLSCFIVVLSHRCINKMIKTKSANDHELTLTFFNYLGQYCQTNFRSTFSPECLLGKQTQAQRPGFFNW